MSNQPPRTRPPARRVNSGSPAPPPPRRQATNVNAPRQRDPFPYVLGGILALMVVGIFLVVFLISSNSGGTTSTGVQPTPTSGTTGGVVTVGPEGSPPTSSTNATPGATPPRMSLVEFKALYDDPAKRANMLIIDVRAKESFDAGHIKGAESWPESDIDATVVKLPKNKLIVGYCQ